MAALTAPMPLEDMQEQGADDRRADVLPILKTLRSQSIGFDNDKDITDARARALDYYKGEHKGYVLKDLPALENRSTVVTTEVADAVETAIPDLIEVFTNGDDSLTFQAFGQEDAEQAKQETDYVRHVIFQQNDGWMLLYTVFKSALLSKVGVFHYYWDGDEEYAESEAIASEPQIEEMVAQGLDLVAIEPAGTVNIFGAPQFRVTVRQVTAQGHVKIEAVAPEDFTVAPGTVKLCDATYCAMRTRASVQQLIADGYDAEKVRALNSDEAHKDERQARDTVNETNEADDSAHPDLREVDIVVHYLRMDLEDEGKPQIWRIVTGNDETVELEREKRARIEFAAVCPYPMPHRFYGQSLADKTIPIQAWMTSITRQINDSVYFANNQRPEIAFNEIIEGQTLEAVVDNTPGKPIITKTGNGVKMIPPGKPAFDALAYLEYIKTVAEQRTGVVRNANGLNPDTLHKTASGAEILIGAAQKRIRMMARLFAEGGLRDLFIGVHDLLRSNATMKDTIQLRNRWVEVDPSSWSRRKNVTIDIGVGSGGRERDLAVFREFAALIEKVIAMQRGTSGPFIMPPNLYQLIDAYADKLGIKGVERFIADPSQQPQQPGQQGPSPEEKAAMAEVEMQKQKIAGEMQIKQFEAAETAKLERFKAEQRAQMERERMAEEKIQARERMIAEMELERERMALRASMEAETMGDPKLTPTRPGGSLSA